MIKRITNCKDLIGKTIAKAKQMNVKNFDDEGFLRLDFTDESFTFIEGGYRDYTGGSD